MNGVAMAVGIVLLAVGANSDSWLSMLVLCGIGGFVVGITVARIEERA